MAKVHYQMLVLEAAVANTIAKPVKRPWGSLTVAPKCHLFSPKYITESVMGVLNLGSLISVAYKIVFPRTMDTIAYFLQSASDITWSFVCYTLKTAS